MQDTAHISQHERISDPSPDGFFVPAEQAIPVLREILKRISSCEELGRRLGISRQAIKKILGGKSQSMRAENFSRAKLLLEQVAGKVFDQIDPDRTTITPEEFYKGKTHVEWSRDLMNTFCFFSQRAAIRAIAKKTNRGEGHAKKLFYPTKQEEGYRVPVDIQECLEQWHRELRSGETLSIDLEQIALPSGEVCEVFRELAFHYENFRALALALGYESNSSILEMLSGKTKTVPAVLYCRSLRLLRQQQGAEVPDSDEALVVHFLRRRPGRGVTISAEPKRLPRRGYVFLDELTGQKEFKSWMADRVKQFRFQSPRAFMKALAHASGLPFTQVERLAAVNSAALTVRRVPLAIKRCIETWEAEYQEGRIFPGASDLHRVPVSDGMTALRQLQTALGNRVELARKLKVSIHQLHKIFEGETHTLSADLVLKIIDLAYSHLLKNWAPQIEYCIRDGELDDALHEIEIFARTDTLFAQYVLPGLRKKISARRAFLKRMKSSHPRDLLLCECDFKSRPVAKALLDQLLHLAKNTNMREGDYPRIIALKLEFISHFPGLTPEEVDDRLSEIISYGLN